MCCYTAVILAAAAVAVCHRVPDGKNCCWFTESDSIYCFLFILKHVFFFHVCTPWQCCRIYGLDFAYTISSVITGMHGAMAVVSPPRRRPPCKSMYRYVGHVVSAIEKSYLDQVLAVNAQTRDEVHHSVWRLLDVPHFARLS